MTVFGANPTEPGYWRAPKGNRGFSVVFFESEDAADRAAETTGSMSNEQRSVHDVEVREVVAQA